MLTRQNTSDVCRMLSVPVASSRRDSGTTTRLTFIVIITASLAGCAAKSKGVFDYATASQTTTSSITAPTSDQGEQPGSKSASALLGQYKSGPGYSVEPNVANDGRFHIYQFSTKYGNYPVVGDALARKHIQELIALDKLKNRSRTDEFLGGVAASITSPMKAVSDTIGDPVGAVQKTYKNAKETLKSVERDVSKAGEFITTFGNPKKITPDRESDGFIEGMVDRPQAKRALARALKVDPYTHFRPLASELDTVASFSAAGKFSLDTAISFVPGVGSIVISSAQTLDSATRDTLDRDPESTAEINRDRLKAIGIPAASIDKLLLNDKLTPTEKTYAVGYLKALSGISGFSELAVPLGNAQSRHEAFTALQTLYLVLSHSRSEFTVAQIKIVDDIPVLVTDRGKPVALLVFDNLSWTSQTAERLARLRQQLANGNRDRQRPELRVTGSATPLAKKMLKKNKWTVRDKILSNLT